MKKKKSKPKPSTKKWGIWNVGCKRWLDRDFQSKSRLALTLSIAEPKAIWFTTKDEATMFLRTSAGNYDYSGFKIVRIS